MSGATEHDQVVARLLSSVPYFEDLDRVSFARLVGALEEVRAAAGELVTEEGTAADSLYLLEEGSVRITLRSGTGEVRVAELSAPAYFGELGLLLSRRTATIRAETDSKLWRLPRVRFEGVVRERPEVGLLVARALAELFDRRQRGLLGVPAAQETHVDHAAARDAGVRRRAPRSRVAGGVAAVAVAALLWWVPPPPGLDIVGWRSLAVVAGAAVAWLLEPVPDYVVALSMAVAWGVTGLAPLPAILGGFASSSWLLALGGLAIAAAMVRSGLLFRAALLMLRTFPPTHRGQVLALVASGIVTTPLVPQSVARVAAIGPLSVEISRSLGQPPRSRGSAGISFAALSGYWFFSHIFLTGFATNFFVLQLIPPAERGGFGWLGWVGAALPAGVVCLVGVLVTLFALFGPEGEGRSSFDALRRQREALGPLSSAERVTLLALVVLVAGLIMQPLVGIEPAWIAGIALVIVAAGVLGREQLRSSIDWGFLLFFGVVIGSASVLQSAGVDRWLAGGLLTLSSRVPSPQALLLLVALITLASRIALPSRPAIILLALAFVPAAPALHIARWVVGFVVLMAANVWVAPYQGLEYVILRDATRGETFDDGQGARFGAALVVVRLVAIAVSIPFWTASGLIGAP
ncbi:MAG: SLC13 family permease [Candidatus Limnocylindria bacterium]